ncbi:hypothetical protein [Tritonibacter mobilis]|uniref:hypothetical protein n=1 Tax=Tritonibacter mobilis TaxID=379347 RepID=UPI000806CBBF|nr:hypothetical protein [Tritonibacter mobilis]
MNYHIYKIVTAKRTIISKKSIEADDVRVVALASFKTEQLRDWTYDRLQSFMEASPDYKDRKFVK